MRLRLRSDLSPRTKVIAFVVASVICAFAFLVPVQTCDRCEGKGAVKSPVEGPCHACNGKGRKTLFQLMRAVD